MAAATAMAVTSSTDVTTHYADSDGVSIAYQVHGEGPLDLVFVPGFVSHVELFWEEPTRRGFLRRLASFARLIVFDKRGQGLSDRPGGPPTLEESMDDLGAVMEAAGCERPAIFGISEGGPMSALFAATYPDRVSSLVLYGTYARILEAPDFPSGVPAEALDACREMVKPEWGGPVGDRPLGAEPGRQPGVRTLVGPAAAAGNEPGGGDRPDRPLPRDRRPGDPAGDRRADPGPPSQRRHGRPGPAGPLPGRPHSGRALRRAAAAATTC